MFLSDNEKKGKMKVLKGLMGKMSELDQGKFKKPVSAEVSVTEVKPSSGLENEMAKAGHDGVEEVEEKIFPEEEEKEEQMMEGGAVDEETKMMIKKLYEKFFGGVA
jgi:hypothetical protein